MTLPNPFQLCGKNSNSTFFSVKDEKKESLSHQDDLNVYEDGEIIDDCNEVSEDNFDILNEPIDPKYCTICQEKEPKYKCPSCKMKTCSLDCVKIHKQAFNCTGIAPPCEYKKLTSMTDQDLQKDYFFLENGCRLIDTLRRDRNQIVKSAEILPSWLKKLLYEAKYRGTRLKILPAGFSKRVKNKTTFIYASKEIHWDVELMFTHITEKGKTIRKISSVTLNRRSEKKHLTDIISEYLFPENAVVNSDIWINYQAYRNAGLKTLKVTLLCEHSSIPIDPFQPLRKILSGRTIIEYPTFVISLPEDSIIT